METEQGRLERLYGEMGDEHLLDLAEDESDLTDEARLVLERELRRRGLKVEAPEVQLNGALMPTPVTEEPEREQGFGPGIPGVFPASASVMEQALEEPQRTKDGMTSLISFYDGIELSKACAILEENEMEPVIEPIAGDAQSGVPPRFEVWVEEGEIDRAKALLRRKMGLFPLAEVDGDGFAEEAATGMVGVFPTQVEAEQVRTLLERAGIDAEVEQDEEYAEWEVTVDPAEQERAVEVVAKGMGLG